MKVPLKNVKPNPFRRIEQYPINAEKVLLLRESIQETGFWENVLARQNAEGDIEIAYGHHRLAALRAMYPETHEVRLTVKQLSDARMLQIMARENMDEWRTNASVLLETVRATVEAYAAGKVSLGEVPRNRAVWRLAPSFRIGPGDELPSNSCRPYTTDMLARFLGFLQPKGKPQQKVDDALAALAFMEQGEATATDFADLTVSQLRAKVVALRGDRAQRWKKEEGGFDWLEQGADLIQQGADLIQKGAKALAGRRVTSGQREGFKALRVQVRAADDAADDALEALTGVDRAAPEAGAAERRATVAALLASAAGGSPSL